MDGKYAILSEKPDSLDENLEASTEAAEADGADFDMKTYPQRLSSKRNDKYEATYDPISNETCDDFDHEDDDGQSPHTQPKPQHLPSIDFGTGTRLKCLATIAFGALCALACILCSIGFWVTSTPSAASPVIILPDGFPGEALSFVVNIILTQCLEGLAYIHSISLRWALLKENRLVFNTNIRLITSSKLSRPNSWYINGVSAALLILCYGATSTLVLPRFDLDNGTSYESHMNLVSLLILGIALLGQTILAVWCYYSNLHDVPTWNSNPLNTTISMIDQGSVQHREGRCMVSVEHRDDLETEPMLPGTRQPSQWQISASVRYALAFIWTLSGLSLAWFLTIMLVARYNMISTIKQVHIPADSKWPETWHFSLSWNPSANLIVKSISMTTYFNAVFFSLDYINERPSMSFIAALIVGFIFVCAIQGLQTLGLHCAELIINLSRDEDTWRNLDAQRETEGKSNVLEEPPYIAALKSWKYMMLLLFKSLLHWLLGQASQPSFDRVEWRVWFTMNYARLFVYVLCAAFFASALTFVALMRPRGPQPATYGHLQTIADLIDDWDLNEDDQFWWGDKGCVGAVRHAGMGCKKERLGLIDTNACYAGKSDFSREFEVVNRLHAR